jgi:hypothetical protein
MMNYLNVVYLDKKHKKPSTEKSSRENAKNGLRIEFFMAWSDLPPKPQTTLWMRADFKGFLCQRLDVGGNESLLTPEVGMIFISDHIFEKDKKMEKNFLMGLARLEDWMLLI